MCILNIIAFYFLILQFISIKLGQHLGNNVINAIAKVQTENKTLHEYLMIYYMHISIFFLIHTAIPGAQHTEMSKNNKIQTS